MQLKSVLFASSLFCLSISTNADTLAFTAGGGIWNESPSGTIQKIGDPAEVDVKDNLFFDTESQGYFFASLEHFVPLVPNVRVMYTNIEHSGSGTTSFTFDNQTFSGTVVSNIQQKSLDLIAYYEVLDNVVSLDLGLNIRKLDIDYTIKSSGTISTDTVSQTVPMLYALVGGSPWPDLILSGEISYIAYSGSSMSDFTAKVAYTTSAFIGVEAGYRKQVITLDDVDGTNADITFDGPFVGAYLKF